MGTPSVIRWAKKERSRASALLFPLRAVIKHCWRANIWTAVHFELVPGIKSVLAPLFRMFCVREMSRFIWRDLGCGLANSLCQVLFLVRGGAAS